MFHIHYFGLKRLKYAPVSCRFCLCDGCYHQKVSHNLSACFLGTEILFFHCKCRVNMCFLRLIGPLRFAVTTSAAVHKTTRTALTCFTTCFLPFGIANISCAFRPQVNRCGFDSKTFEQTCVGIASL